jgi:hypothetical protein
MSSFLDIAVLALQRLGILAALPQPLSRRLTLLITFHALRLTFYVSRFTHLSSEVLLPKEDSIQYEYRNKLQYALE